MEQLCRLAGFEPDCDDESLSGQMNMACQAVEELQALLSERKGADGRETCNVLQQWLQDTSFFADLFPFSELYRSVLHVVSSLSLAMSSYLEIISFCEQFTKEEGALTLLFHDCRELRQSVEGLQPGRPYSSNQGKYLATWLNYHAPIAKKPPFSGIYHDILTVFTKKKISSSEYDTLLRKVAEVEEEMTKAAERSGGLLHPSYSSVEDLCRKEKTLRIAGARICLAGEMKMGTVKTWEKKLRESGAIPCDTVTAELDYLAIGSNASPCWEFSPYSFKVRQVLQYQKSGSPMGIVRESNLYLNGQKTGEQ